MEVSTSEDTKIDPPAEIFTIVSPSFIRPLSDYHVVINLMKADKPETFKITIKSEHFEDSKQVDVQPNTKEILNFQIPNIKYGTYYLKAEPLGNEKYSEEITLGYEREKYFVMFQTDKSTYKAGDLVRYRIIMLNLFLRPVQVDTPIDIWIKDSEENRVFQQKNVQLKNNIFSGEMQLSDSPILGSWSIVLCSDEHEYSKQFEVAEYVLPKFEISLDAPKNILYKNQKFSATIKAKYAFGKPVQGTSVFSIGNSRKTVPIDGKATVEFDLIDDLQMHREMNDYLTLEAQVEESPSGEIQKATAEIDLYSKEYSFSVLESPRIFSQGVPFPIRIKVYQYNGKPPTDCRKIFFYFETHHEPGEVFNVAEHTLDENGELRTMITLDGDKDQYSIKAVFLENDFFVGLIYNKEFEKEPEPEKKEEIEGPPEPFLKATLQNTGQLNFKDEAVFEITTNQSLSQVFYIIVARGQIATSDCVEMPDTKSCSVKVNITEIMIPYVNFFFYGVYEDKLVYDELVLNTVEELPDNIQINAPEKARPGEILSISVNSGPNACLGLLGIDKSATILNNDNEITSAKVLAEIRKITFRATGGGPGKKCGLITISNCLPEISFRCLLKKRKLCKKSGGVCDAMEIESEEIAVRKDFPEVWIWNEIDATENSGLVSMETKVSDSITTWLLSGFSLDPVTGLNLTKYPRELQVFQEFFVSAELPYSVKQGEIFELPVIIFNYTNDELKTEVTLDNSLKEFEFLTKDKSADSNKDNLQLKDVVVKSDSSGITTFLIRPKVVGSIKIHLTAKTPNSGDAIERFLLVEPEGVTKFVNNAILVDLREQDTFENKILVDIPKEVVPDSTHVYVTAIGDLLGPIFSNLDDLVRLPYGCGEQNMVNFVPNILVLKYLKAVGLEMEKLEIQAKKYMEIGYQRELTYKHPDGSYSLFGPSDTHYKSSTWLTAYVAKSFRQASDLIHIEESIIKSGLDFIAKVQTEQGSFEEFGYTSDLPTDIKAKGLIVTTFSLLALLENSKEYPEFNERIAKGLDYLAQQVKGSDNVNFIAICAYALQLGNHKDKNSVMKILGEKSNVEGSNRWWKHSENNVWNSKEVETTSYALLAFLEDESTPVEYIAQILKWMLSQRNDKGGFHSSQDTVIGLQAVTKAAQKLYSSDTEMSINFVNDRNESKSMNVSKDNSLVLQTEKLPIPTKEVTVHAKGHGMALVQVTCKYNLSIKVSEPKFVILPEISLNPDIQTVKLAFKTHFIPDPNGPKSSSMAIMEVTLPSGYTFNCHSKTALIESKNVKKVELKKLDTLVIIYFNSLDSAETSISFDALRSHNVVEQKPVPVVVYDYYNKSYQARAFYSLPESK